MEKVRLLVSDEILSQAGVSAEEDDDQKEREEFKKFVNGVKASDFKSFAVEVGPEKLDENVQDGKEAASDDEQDSGDDVN